MYTPWVEVSYNFHGYEFGLFDVAGMVIVVILFSMFFMQFVKDRNLLAKQDPLKPLTLKIKTKTNEIVRAYIYRICC